MLLWISFEITTILSITLWRCHLILFGYLYYVVSLQWVVQGAIDVDIGANPSAEGGGDDEGVDDQAVKVVDIVDTFRLQVALTSITLALVYDTICTLFLCLNSMCVWQEQPPFDKKQFVTFMKRYIKNLSAKLDAEKQEEFKKNIEGATKYLLGKLKDLQL